MDAKTRIRGDFYAGAYGPTVLLKFGSADAALLLCEMFLRLVEGQRTIRLCPHPVVSIEHVDQIELRLVRTPPGKHFRRAGAPRTFVWEATADEWTALAALVQPFCSGEIGHQYLTSEVADDALVTVSLGEGYPDL